VTIPYNRDMVRVSAATAVCWIGLATVGLACLPACNQSSARRGQLASRYPLDRVRAAVQLTEAGDTEAVDLLIELLNDRDRGVRMYTILALERLCGETYGYEYYDPEPAREAAIGRWREARQQGEVRVQGHSPQPQAGGTAAAATESGTSGGRSP